MATRQSKLLACQLIWLHAFLLLLISVTSANGQSTVRISVYGAVQKDAPVRVVGFRYEISRIDIDLLNESEKTISAVRPLIGELGCARKHSPTEGVGLGPVAIRIGPHERATLPSNESPLSPTGLVMEAQDWRLTHVAMQIGVMEVDFTDGTGWSSRRQLAFDPSPVEADADACPDPSNLQSAPTVHRIRFQRRNPALVMPTKQRGGLSVPGVLFTCALSEDEVKGDVVATCPDSSVTVADDSK